MPSLTKIEAERFISPSYLSMKQEVVRDSSFLRTISLGMVALGCLLRIIQYLLHRSLWMDEAYLSLNILHRSFSGLWHPLEYHQGAPIAFLMLEKSAVSWLGGSEYGLRLIPLLAGVAAVVLFYKLAGRILPPKAVAIATGLFAISPALIYYSAEVKQYSSDAAIAIALYCLTIDGSKSEWKARQIALSAAVGSLAIWMSHSAVFVLAGISITVLAALLLRKDWNRLARVSLVVLFWAASLAICYFLSLRNLASDADLLNYWKTHFMPLPPRSVTDLKWFLDSFFDFFASSAGLKFTGLAAFVALSGAIAMYRKSVERVFLLTSPALFTLAASGLHKYPFGGRLTLFLVPAGLLLMAEGAYALCSSMSSSFPYAGGVLLTLIFLDPGVYVLHHFAKPHTEVEQPGIMRPEEIRPVLAYVRAHEEPGDLVYIFSESEPAFAYYAERDGFPRNNVEIGSASGSDPRAYASDLNPLQGHRVWVVLSHTHGIGAEESRYVLFYLDNLGSKRECFASAGANACLYDLRNPVAPGRSQSSPQVDFHTN